MLDIFGRSYRVLKHITLAKTRKQREQNLI